MADNKGRTKVLGGTKRRRRKRVGVNTVLNDRTKWLVGIFALGLMVLVCRLAWFQLINTEKWRSGATQQQLRSETLTATRGSVYDANQEILVKSTAAWSVTVTPSAFKEKAEGQETAEFNVDKYDATMTMLCETLGLTQEYIDLRMKETTYFGGKNETVKLKNKADKTQRDTINQFLEDNEIEAVTLSMDTRRTYVRGTLASTLLGFVGTDNIGLAGLEQKYDEELSGVDGRIVVAKDARGNKMSDDYNILVDAQEGNSLVLTIDATVQACMEKYLAQAVKENDVRNRASAIMMNVKTGAILGMATMPDYDPANYYEIADDDTRKELERIVDDDERKEKMEAARQSQWRNKCVSDTYEPGSVFKPITMSAALEEGVVSVNDTFNCPGYKVVGGRRINCHKSSGHGTESLTKGMMNSCNPVFMTLGERLGGSRFFKYFKAFGFTEKTGIDLPGETATVAGISYHTEESLNKYAADLAVSSFGQTNAVTPIQMITAIAAVCNGGYLVEPYVVGQVLDSDGNIVSNHETVVKRQVISKETSDLVNSMLEATVSEGTAKNGYIAGYRIGGKTGTSEKIAETAATGVKTYVASFCAIAPCDDPEIALLVLLDDPRGSSHMGGTIAAPVARNILSEMLPYLGIETIYTQEDLAILDTITPNVRSKTVEEAKEELSAKGLKVRVEGDGLNVTGQIPQGGQSIPKGGTVVLTTESSGEVTLVTVPDVKGFSPSEANSEVVNSGLNIRYSGSGYDTSSGRAVSQSIPAGTKVERGTVVTVDFIMSGATD